MLQLYSNETTVYKSNSFLSAILFAVQLHLVSKMDTTDIQDCFRGKSVFLTGFTGFVGKLVLEKLLRCCNDVEKVYLLVRSKRGKSAEERVKEICKLPVNVKIWK